jgi:hypothetical protein
MTRASLHRVLRERIEASAAAGVLMAASSLVLRLLDIIEAIEHIRGETVGVALDAFGADWRER